MDSNKSVESDTHSLMTEDIPKSNVPSISSNMSVSSMSSTESISHDFTNIHRVRSNSDFDNIYRIRTNSNLSDYDKQRPAIFSEQLPPIHKSSKKNLGKKQFLRKKGICSLEFNNCRTYSSDKDNDELCSIANSQKTTPRVQTIDIQSLNRVRYRDAAIEKRISTPRPIVYLKNLEENGHWLNEKSVYHK